MQGEHLFPPKTNQLIFNRDLTPQILQLGYSRRYLTRCLSGFYGRPCPHEADTECHARWHYDVGEFTGRICPAPCEASCTLNIVDSPVTIKSIECSIVDKAWDNGWIKPQINQNKTNKKIGIIGSGPAGLAAAQQLARAGHSVIIYEKNKKMGGLLRYGRLGLELMCRCRGRSAR